MTHGHGKGWKCIYCPTSSLVRSNFKFTQDRFAICVACANKHPVVRAADAMEYTDKHLERGE